LGILEILLANFYFLMYIQKKPEKTDGSDNEIEVIVPVASNHPQRARRAAAGPVL